MKLGATANKNDFKTRYPILRKLTGDRTPFDGPVRNSKDLPNPGWLVTKKVVERFHYGSGECQLLVDEMATNRIMLIWTIVKSFRPSTHSRGAKQQSREGKIFPRNGRRV